LLPALCWQLFSDNPANIIVSFQAVIADFLIRIAYNGAVTAKKPMKNHV